jgi:putative oxidoreductase
MNSQKDIAALVGRLLLAYMFVLAGIGKLSGYDGTAGYMTAAGLPLVGVLLPLTILVELGGGIALAIGWKARWAALVLAAFTLLASLVFHNYWAMKPEAVMANTLFFNKNLGVIGGMLMVFAFGPGRFSVDRATSVAEGRSLPRA